MVVQSSLRSGERARMTRIPRLIASDLDGTLLGPDGEVSARTRASLDRSEEHTSELQSH